jgi:hypothetical protein
MYICFTEHPITKTAQHSDSEIAWEHLTGLKCLQEPVQIKSLKIHLVYSKLRFDDDAYSLS